jgi:hypothetical protein
MIQDSDDIFKIQIINILISLYVISKNIKVLTKE